MVWALTYEICGKFFNTGRVTHFCRYKKLRFKTTSSAMRKDGKITGLASCKTKMIYDDMKS